MREIISSILTNVLFALYQSAWFSLAFAVLMMYVCIIANEKIETGLGWKKTVYIWIDHFKKSQRFRRVFLLLFYVSMILFRTLFGRNFWINSLTNVIGYWWPYVTNPETGEVKLTTECIENLILFIPFTYLLLWVKNQGETIRCVIWKSVKIVFVFSLSIEFTQLFLHVGTFQLSDLFYNTLGGAIGGVLYWVSYRLNDKFT